MPPTIQTSPCVKFLEWISARFFNYQNLKKKNVEGSIEALLGGRGGNVYPLSEFQVRSFRVLRKAISLWVLNPSLCHLSPFHLALFYFILLTSPKQ